MKRAYRNLPACWHMRQGHKRKFWSIDDLFLVVPTTSGLVIYACILMAITSFLISIFKCFWR